MKRKDSERRQNRKIFGGRYRRDSDVRVKVRISMSNDKSSGCQYERERKHVV